MIRGAILPAVIAGLALLARSTVAQEVVTPEELDTVLVVGERAGPALWKIRRGDHTLWILPTLAPLPRQLVWRSTEVEQVIAASQEIYSEATLTIQVGGSGKDDVQILEALANDDRKWLRDVLPPDLYAQFNALNARYAGNDMRLELLRPFYAATELRKRALQRLQLDSDARLHSTVAAQARKHVVALRSLERVLAPRPATLARNIRRAPRQVDIDCARWQLLQLERELRDAVTRANAWAAGDIAALRRDWEIGQRQKQQASCMRLFQDLAPTARAIRETRSRGFSALETALRRNRSTVALVLLEDVFDPDGVIARFRRAGYTVEPPRPE